MAMALIVESDVTNNLICKDCNGYFSGDPVNIVNDKGAICGRCTEDQIGPLSKINVIAENSPCRNRPSGPEMHQQDKKYLIGKRLACGLPECGFKGFALQLLQHFRSAHQQLILPKNEVALDLGKNSQEVYIYCKNDSFFYFGVEYSHSSRELFCFVLPFAIDGTDPVCYKVMVKTDEGVCVFEETNNEDRGVTVSLADFPKFSATLVIETMDLACPYVPKDHLNNFQLDIPQLETQVSTITQNGNQITEETKYILPRIIPLNEGVKDSVNFVVENLGLYKKDFRIFCKPFRAISQAWNIELFPSYQLNKSRKFLSVTLKCTEHCVPTWKEQMVVVTLKLKHPIYLEKRISFPFSTNNDVCTFVDFVGYHELTITKNKELNLEFELILDTFNSLEKPTVLNAIKAAQKTTLQIEKENIEANKLVPKVTSLNEDVKEETPVSTIAPTITQNGNQITEETKYILPRIIPLNEGAKDSVNFVVENLGSYKKDFRIFCKPFRAISQAWNIELFPSYQLNKSRKFLSVTLKCTEHCVPTWKEQMVVVTLKLKHPIYLEKRISFPFSTNNDVCTFVDFVGYPELTIMKNKELNLEFELILDTFNSLEKPTVLNAIKAAQKTTLQIEKENIEANKLVPKVTSLNEGVKDSVVFTVENIRSYKKDFRILCKPFQAISQTWNIELFPSYQLNRTHKFLSVTLICTEHRLSRWKEQNITATLTLRYPVYLEKQMKFPFDIDNVCTFTDFMAYNELLPISKNKVINLEFELFLETSNSLEKPTILNSNAAACTTTLQKQNESEEPKQVLMKVISLNEGVKDSVVFTVENIRSYKKDFKILCMPFWSISRIWSMELFPSYQLNKTRKFLNVALKCTEPFLPTWEEQNIVATLKLKHPIYIEKQIKFPCNLGNVCTFIDFMCYEELTITKNKEINLEFELILDTSNAAEKPTVLNSIIEGACITTSQKQEERKEGKEDAKHIVPNVTSLNEGVKDRVVFITENVRSYKKDFQIFSKPFKAISRTFTIEIFPTYQQNRTQKFLSVSLKCTEECVAMIKNRNIVATLILKCPVLRRQLKCLCHLGNVCTFFDFVAYSDPNLLKDKKMKLEFELVLDASHSLDKPVILNSNVSSSNIINNVVTPDILLSSVNRIKKEIQDIVLFTLVNFNQDKESFKVDKSFEALSRTWVFEVFRTYQKKTNLQKFLSVNLKCAAISASNLKGKNITVTLNLRSACQLCVSKTQEFLCDEGKVCIFINYVSFDELQNLKTSLTAENSFITFELILEISNIANNLNVCQAQAKKMVSSGQEEFTSLKLNNSFINLCLYDSLFMLTPEKFVIFGLEFEAKGRVKPVNSKRSNFLTLLIECKGNQNTPVSDYFITISMKSTLANKNIEKIRNFSYRGDDSVVLFENFVDIPSIFDLQSGLLTNDTLTFKIKFRKSLICSPNKSLPTLPQSTVYSHSFTNFTKRGYVKKMSSYFYIADLCWCISINPIAKDNFRMLGIFLVGTPIKEPEHSSWSCPATFNFTIRGDNLLLNTTQMSHVFHQGEFQKGFENVLDWDEVVCPGSGCLLKDALVVNLKLTAGPLKLKPKKN